MIIRVGLDKFIFIECSLRNCYHINNIFYRSFHYLYCIRSSPTTIHNMTTCITKADITELRGLAKPPQAVKDTMSAVLAILGYKKPDAEVIFIVVYLYIILIGFS